MKTAGRKVESVFPPRRASGSAVVVPPQGRGASISTGGPQPQRFDWLDALRGFAMLWMTVFHAAFDLNLKGLIAHQNFYDDPVWTVQRTVILSLFLLCAGAGQAAALAQVVSWPRFWRRWSRVAACALLVSLASWWMFPRSWISFGVLHGLAAMLLLQRLLAARSSAVLVLLAAACLLLPHALRSEVFDSRWTNWVGLVTHKPVTEDYVPLLPWFGVMLAGFVGMRRLVLQRPSVVSLPVGRWLAPLARLGRWSLPYYMLHQPVLLGVIGVWATWTAH